MGALGVVVDFGLASGGAAAHAQAAQPAQRMAVVFGAGLEFVHLVWHVERPIEHRQQRLQPRSGGATPRQDLGHAEQLQRRL